MMTAGITRTMSQKIKVHPLEIELDIGPGKAVNTERLINHIDAIQAEYYNHCIGGTSQFGKRFCGDTFNSLPVGYRQGPGNMWFAYVNHDAYVRQICARYEKGPN
jgi:hypothetical protein